MSEPDQISKHQHAVADYLKELLTEPATSTSAEQSHDHWKQTPFQAQLISVAGLNLAIPEHQVAYLLNRHEMPSSINKDYQGIKWYLDTIQYQNNDIHRIDTAGIIFPPDYPIPQEEANYIVVIKNSRWGLSCHKVNEIITIQPESVTWRKQMGRRAWLAGTFLDKKLSVINVEGLSTLLENTFKS